MEQIGPLLVFGLLQGLQLAATLAHRLKLEPAQAAVLRMQVRVRVRARARARARVHVRAGVLRMHALLGSRAVGR
jgi:hypothetical protein